MSNDPFSDARPGFIRLDDVVGRLILVNPKEIVTKKSNLKGKGDDTYDVVIGDAIVLDGELTEEIEELPAVVEDMHLSGSVLVGQLRAKVNKPAEQGGMVLGRVAKQKSQTKGFGDAWVLQSPTEDDKVLARPAAARYIAELKALAVDPFGSAE